MDDLDKIISEASTEVSEVSKQEAAPEAASVPVVESGEPAADVAQPSQEVEQPIEAPQHWDADKREAFKNLPRAAQDIVLERVKATEADHTRKTQEVAQQRKELEPLLNTTKQYESYFKQLGVTPEQAFATLVNTERLLRTGSASQKSAAFAQLASDYGIDLRALGAAPTGEAANPNTPNLTPFVSELATVNQRLDSFEMAQLSERVNSFSSTKGSDGQPLYPHFDKVRAKMGELSAATGKQNLSELYEEACYLVPEVRQAIIDAKLEQARKEQTENARKAAAEARKAGVVNMKAAEPVIAAEPTDLDSIIKGAIAAA
jgi:hypothetical protein